MNQNLNILQPTRIDLLNVKVNSSLTIPLASNIPLSGAREASLAVKVSFAQFAGTTTGPTFSVQLLPALPSDDGQVYQTNTPLISAGPPNNNPPTYPTLYTGTNISATPVALGAWANLVLVYTQYSATVTTALVTFSVDLVLKS